MRHNWLKISPQDQANMPPKQCTKSKPNIAKSSNQIRLPISREEYAEIIKDRDRFRQTLDRYIEQYPELFPAHIQHGYHFYGMARSSKKMPDVERRQIRLLMTDDQGEQPIYTIVPSFVMPYMTGDTDVVEKALFLRRFGVPFWALTYVFGRNDLYWQRLVAQFGHNHIVGTTLKAAQLLPDHLLADEKHTRLNGEKAYIATTVAEDCVLGISMALAADEEHLTAAYGDFKQEAHDLKPNYQPQTVNTDGWAATQLAWRTLFPQITIILCFLHAFISIRSRCKRLKDKFPEIKQRVWDIYRAEHAASFREQITALEAWSHQNLVGRPLASVLKLCGKADLFVLAFDHPQAYRTSNMIDRHLDPLDRCLYSAHYFHGHLSSAEYQLRAWALFHNFQPYCPRAKIREKYQSPFHKLNGFVYHDNWLHNLLVATSLGGCNSIHAKR
jgi:hypothetical protein